MIGITLDNPNDFAFSRRLKHCQNIYFTDNIVTDSNKKKNIQA